MVKMFCSHVGTVPLAEGVGVVGKVVGPCGNGTVTVLDPPDPSS
jgi:hypothetical protein